MKSCQKGDKRRRRLVISFACLSPFEVEELAYFASIDVSVKLVSNKISAGPQSVQSSERLPGAKH